MKIYFHKVRPVQALDGLRAATASKGMDIRRSDAAGAERLLHRPHHLTVKRGVFFASQKNDAFYGQVMRLLGLN
ncbi:MAG: hypothetical protein Q9O24_10750 [Gammaproteobacteria bacterium]|nr:hypothetical protein [Gammaproteobacteria bacterium]